VEPETENDAARESCSAHKPGGKFSLSGSSSETQKGFIENVRHVEA
jgi:hypothetical protein